MIKQVKAFQLLCDDCGDMFEDDVFLIWVNEGDMLDAAVSWDWDIRTDGKQLCQSCASIAKAG